MRKWWRQFFGDLAFFALHVWTAARGHPHPENPGHRAAVLIGALVSCAGMSLIAFFVAREIATFGPVNPPPRREPVFDQPDLTRPVREEPRRFLARTHLPRCSEPLASGPLSPKTFFPKVDLVRIDDERVWWESEHDHDDSEDDHIMHRAMEMPLRRLIELTSRNGGTLRVHDAFRPEGIHVRRSLHREGRAIDVTCDELGLEKLAKLSWAAGFDWVYHEAPKRGGAHVHCSVRPGR